jgi:putative glutamine amidotransferase
MKPLIGITIGEIVDQPDPWLPKIYGQRYQYSDAIVAAGGIPVYIPFMPEDELKNLYNRLDGILFAGGDDIDPQLYGEKIEEGTEYISAERDKLEAMLMTWTLADDKPLLAICRGYQMLNVLLGGSLYQNIAKALPEANDHLASTHQKDSAYIAHKLKIEPTSKFAFVTDSLNIDANSRHHQGIKRVANELRAVAWSEDWLVEAIEHPNKTFAIGVQCHPESLATVDKKWAALFSGFVKATSHKRTPATLFKFKKRIKY